MSDTYTYSRRHILHCIRINCVTCQHIYLVSNQHKNQAKSERALFPKILTRHIPIDSRFLNRDFVTIRRSLLHHFTRVILGIIHHDGIAKISPRNLTSSWRAPLLRRDKRFSAIVTDTQFSSTTCSAQCDDV